MGPLSRSQRRRRVVESRDGTGVTLGFGKPDQDKALEIPSIRGYAQYGTLRACPTWIC
jgi:hypothetical protein